MNHLTTSEFILNADGSIYHLNLRPEHLADTVITVGDPDRVAKITKYFDAIEFETRKREFHTQTGTYKGKRITVISTGIGTDNIDIVMNELDALANIDFDTRTIKEELRSLDIIRIGTSGSLQKEIPIDSLLLSRKAVGFDSLLHYYKREGKSNIAMEKALIDHLQLFPSTSRPYVVNGNKELADRFKAAEMLEGITGTNIGFYAPQGRVLRLALRDPKLNEKITSFNFRGKKITNMEMETAAIYGMAYLMGHRAVSLNAIVANRVTGEFSNHPGDTVEKLITFALERIVR